MAAAQGEALFDLPTAFVKVDDQRGHIALAANPFGQCDGAFVDLGSELHWWANTALHLDRAGARLLGEALISGGPNNERYDSARVPPSR